MRLAFVPSPWKPLFLCDNPVSFSLLTTRYTMHRVSLSESRNMHSRTFCFRASTRIFACIRETMGFAKWRLNENRERHSLAFQFSCCCLPRNTWSRVFNIPHASFSSHFHRWVSKSCVKHTRERYFEYSN